VPPNFSVGNDLGTMSQSVGIEIIPLWRALYRLTIKEIENAKPRDRKYKLADGAIWTLMDPHPGPARLIGES
jgi:hypothetical protein